MVVLVKHTFLSGRAEGHQQILAVRFDFPHSQQQTNGRLWYRPPTIPGDFSYSHSLVLCTFGLCSGPVFTWGSAVPGWLSWIGTAIVLHIAQMTVQTCCCSSGQFCPVSNRPNSRQEKQKQCCSACGWVWVSSCQMVLVVATLLLPSGLSKAVVLFWKAYGQRECGSQIQIESDGMNRQEIIKSNPTCQMSYPLAPTLCLGRLRWDYGKQSGLREGASLWREDITRFITTFFSSTPLWPLPAWVRSENRSGPIQLNCLARSIFHVSLHSQQGCAIPTRAPPPYRLQKVVGCSWS